LVVPYKDKGAPCDREDPLDVFATLTTASALEPERALLLMDEPMRQRQVAANREMGGKLLAEQPLPDRHGYIVTHWVELERDGRLYRVFRLGSRARPMGEIAPSAGSVVLVKSATGWLQTGNLAGDPVGSWAMTMPFENLVGSHSLTP
jgi:hypothetical protein